MFSRLSRAGAITLSVGAHLIGSMGCADPCSAESLRTRLEGSEVGDVIDVGSCPSIEGDFNVPPGRTLRSSATPRATIRGTVLLETRADVTTTLESISLSTEDLAIETVGPGTAAIQDTTVEVTRGVGLSLRAARTEISDCEISGNVTEANRDESRWLSVTSATDATHGVVVGAGVVRIARCRITGFAWTALSAGADLVRGGSGPIDLRVLETTIGHGLGVGISSSAESLDLTNVHIEEIWTGVRGWPSYGLLVIAGDVTSGDSAITDADGFGLVQIAGTSNHVNAVIEHTGDVGAWFGTGVSAGFLGGGTRIADTGFAGILAVDAATLGMVGGSIVGVRAERRTVGVSGAIDVGDGIDAIGTRVVLQNVSISGAERAGLLIDGAASTDARDFQNVTVTSAGTGLGAVRGTIDRVAEDFAPAAVPGWDVGITRAGAAIANDAAFTGVLAVAVSPTPPSASDALGVIAPMY